MKRVYQTNINQPTQDLTEQVLRNLTEQPENNMLIDKYNWFNIQDSDLELCKEAGPYGCEVPDALEFFSGVDDVAWKDSGFGNGRDAVCLKKEHGSWTFADIRGSIRFSKEK